MDKDEMIAILKESKQPDEDIVVFLELHGDQIKDHWDLRFSYGKFLMSRYGKVVTVEWDPEVEGFYTL